MTTKEVGLFTAPAGVKVGLNIVVLAFEGAGQVVAPLSDLEYAIGVMCAQARDQISKTESFMTDIASDWANVNLSAQANVVGGILSGTVRLLWLNRLKNLEGVRANLPMWLEAAIAHDFVSAL